jgi:chromosome segregation ATPase
MPDVEENKTVDIDTSGPGAEIELENDSKETEAPEVETPEVETKAEETVEATDTKEEPKEQKEKELEQYSESVQRRIAKLTHKWREAERQKDEAAAFAKAQIKLKEAAEAKISKLEPGYLQSTEDSIVSGMQAAQAKLAAAREAQDLKAEAEALTAISELGYKKAKLEETKVAQEEFNKNKKAEPELKLEQKAKPQQAPDPKAEAWAAKNSWFGQDNAMTYTAFDLHKTLTEQEGFDPQSDEYYSEIDRRIRLEFPHKFGNNESNNGEVSTKPVQTVASAKRSTNTGRKTVRLTPSQVAIAKKLGVPLEEYAKQLKITKEV